MQSGDTGQAISGETWRESVAVAGRSAPIPVHTDHTVQFYEDPRYLARAVAEFAASGLQLGQPVILIMTDALRDACTRHLTAAGCNVTRLVAGGQLVMLSAGEMLSRFMNGALPDATRFEAIIGGLLDRSRLATGHAMVRLYGEMVTLLWRDANADGAIRLEELWNDLARTQSFTLLCGYAMSDFNEEWHGRNFVEICNRHAHVIPAESYTLIDDDARMREISLLQQRALALESEVKRRRALESRLRDALLEHGHLLDREKMARAEAEAASRAKSMFLAMMSHELRTPLNAIGGYTDLLELGVRGPVSDEQRGDLSRIRHSQQHLLTLINDVLNFAKLNAGDVSYRLSPMQLTGLFDRVEDLMHTQMRGKGVRCEFEPTSLTVHTDGDKLAQILLNLLSNALKFTNAGGLVVVSAEHHDADTVCITVRDTGRGIPANRIEAIFDPFVQVGRSLSKPGDGVGLGLAISRDLARAMGGDLAAASELGVGSTFVVTLPAGIPAH